MQNFMILEYEPASEPLHIPLSSTNDAVPQDSVWVRVVVRMLVLKSLLACVQCAPLLGVFCEDQVLNGPASGERAPWVGPIGNVILARE